MRDLLFLGFLPYFLLLIMLRPFVGAAMWIWVSLFVPASWVWGVAGRVRFNLLVVLVAVAAYLLMKNKPRVAWTSTATLAVLFYMWFSVSAYFAITESDVPFRWWDTFTRIIALFVFCQLVLARRLHWDVFIWAMLLAMGGYGMLEALKYLLSGLNHSIVGIPGGQHRDRNDLALALNAMIPLAVYLYSCTTSKFVRYGLLAMIVMLAVAIVGTFSRGGLITLVGIAGFYLVVSGRKFIPAAIVLAVLAFGLSFVVTDQYAERAQTIQAIGEDESFMGRVAAWKLSVYIALDRPLIGGGPFAVQTRDVWPRYAHVYDPDQWVSTGPFSNATRAAHSLYFQVLGDTGFAGFFIYMAMLASALTLMWRTRQSALRRADARLASLSTALLLSLMSIMLAGAALSVAYFDLVFGILALIAAVGGRARLANERRESRPKDARRSPLPRRGKHAGVRPTAGTLGRRIGGDVRRRDPKNEA
jgi:probable O-glycosylation ligase (exosortase A-associated)